MLLTVLAHEKKRPKLSFKVRLTIFFFTLSTLVQIGIVAIVRPQIQKASMVQNYQYLQEEAIMSASTISEVLLTNLKLMQLLSSNAQIINQLNQSNQEYARQGQGLRQYLTNLEAEWLSSPESQLVRGITQNSATQELQKASVIFPHFNQLLITNKYGGLVAGVKYGENFDFSQKNWWQTTYKEGQGNIYIGDIKVDDLTEKISVSLAIPVYANLNSSEIIGIIYVQHNLNDELQEIFSKLNEPDSQALEDNQVQDNHIHRIYLDDNTYLDYENQEIVTNTPLNLATLQEEAEVDQYLTYEGKPHYIALKTITNLESDTPIGQTINDLNWTLVTIAPYNRPHILSVSGRMTVILLLLVTSILIALWVINVITTPLKLMIDVAQDINDDKFSEQDLEKLDKVMDLDNNIGELAKVFKSTILIVSQRTQNLKQKIEQMESSENFASNDQITYQNDFAQTPQAKMRMAILQKSQALRSKYGHDTPTMTGKTLKQSSQQPKSIEKLQQELAKYIGPLAEHIVNDIMTEHPELTTTQLIDLLAQEIPDEEKAQEFKQQAIDSLLEI